MNNTLPVSRMTSLMDCPRKQFWAYEIGLRESDKPVALRVGSAWARGMEARWNGKSYEDALAIAVPEGIQLNPFDVHTVAALLAGYYDTWGEPQSVILPEVQFKRNLPGTRFVLNGALDGLGTLPDGRNVVVESKTTGSDISPGSDYWERLRFNMQVLNYVAEAREMGWDVSTAVYDVTRKPTIRPYASVDVLDEQGRKIVLDQNGERVFLQAGKNAGEPRQSGDTAKGFVVQCQPETPEQYSDRLWKDTQARPDFYFARREIPIIDGDLESFKRHRFSVANLIEHFRSNERRGGERDAEAWPRNVNEESCKWCPYRNFCLQNVTPDLKAPPVGLYLSRHIDRTMEELEPLSPQFQVATELKPIKQNATAQKTKPSKTAKPSRSARSGGKSVKPRRHR